MYRIIIYLSFPFIIMKIGWH